MVYYIYGKVIIMLNGNPPLARNVGHVISMISVKWAYYCYENHMGDHFKGEYGNGMLCFMAIGYMMVDIIDLERSFWRLSVLHSWIWLMVFNVKGWEVICI